MKPIIHPETGTRDLNLDYLLYSPTFILPVLFPFMCNTAKTLPIDFEIEKSGFETILIPSEIDNSNLHPVATAQGIAFDPKETHGFEQEGKYDYIVLNPDRNDSLDENGLKRCLAVLMPLLKPWGIIAGRVFGYSGYHGLNMLRSIVKRFEAVEPCEVCKPHSCNEKSDKVNRDNKNENTANLIRKIIDAIPGNHPAYSRKKFIEKLWDGNPVETGIFLSLESRKIFTLSQLILIIETGGGKFIEPTFPGLYNPLEIISDTVITDRIISLPTPHRWKTAELVNAWPPEHYFFIKKTDFHPVEIRIPWDNYDPMELFSWRPLRLPLYEWDDLTSINQCQAKSLLTPIPQLNGINPIELIEWEAQFFHSCNGISSIDDMRSGKTPGNVENQIKNVPVTNIIEFLKLATEYRLIALLPTYKKEA